MLDESTRFGRQDCRRVVPEPGGNDSECPAASAGDLASGFFLRSGNRSLPWERPFAFSS